MTTRIYNKYVAQNQNMTLDTMTGDFHLVEWAAAAQGSLRGGLQALVQVSRLCPLELDSQALQFNWKTSNN